MKVIALIQARMSSIRLPNKVMKPIGGVPMIELLLKRLAKAKEVDQIIVATSDNKCNIPLITHVRNIGFAYEKGSENDVLDRYLNAALLHQADAIVRITGDCPLVDPELVDEVILRFKDLNVDYISNVDPPTYPDGLDIEVFTLEALKKASRETNNLFDREHVTPYLRKPGIYKTDVILNSEDLSSMRWTVDEVSDFKVIEKVFAYFHPKIDFSWRDVLDLQKHKPEIFNLNQHLVRNEGAEIGSGQKLWKRAKLSIPGGNMLLSKAFRDVFT
jgi:glutamate-1-semialdehyde 2,1-aminomutase